MRTIIGGRAMVIPIKYAQRRVYHFTHITNLPGLLRHGFLAKNHPNFPARNLSIAASGIQQRRAEMDVTCGAGGCVLNVINAKNVDQEDLLYFEFPIDLVTAASSAFTNASANTDIPPGFFDDPRFLDELDWAAIDDAKWGGPDAGYKHRRMAELLVHHPLPVNAALTCVVFDADAKRRVEELVANAPFPDIEMETWERRHFFRDFSDRTQSLVKGPRKIAETFRGACGSVRACRRPVANARFKSLGALLGALRNDFGCLPQTAELVGLESANCMHRHTADVHTRDVVARLLASQEYEDLGDDEKGLVELAAYLHDIGKGPRSRWGKYGGIQQVDTNHPVGAMPMMIKILTELVETVSIKGGRRLLQLVCYHDLIGDVIGNERDEQQLIDILEDEEELDMLFALSKADVTSIREEWWSECKAEALYTRCLNAIRGRGRA
jgi:hypothetical protein